jgi:hypothetical protein
MINAAIRGDKGTIKAIFRYSECMLEGSSYHYHSKKFISNIAQRKVNIFT